MKKHIPNIITALNLFAGCVGIRYAFTGDFEVVFYCMLASGIFDFLDGTAARILNVHSAIGKELDSLADVISFGFLPGTIVFTLLQTCMVHPYLPYIGFVITIFSAIRLAKFNIDTRQTTDFIGVNTPTNSFLVISLPFIAEEYPNLILNPYFLISFTLISSYLLVSELKMFSMKITSDLSWANNKFRYLFVLSTIVLLVILKLTAIPIVFVLYIVLSQFHFATKKP